MHLLAVDSSSPMTAADSSLPTTAVDSMRWSHIQPADHGCLEQPNIGAQTVLEEQMLRVKNIATIKKTQRLTWQLPREA